MSERRRDKKEGEICMIAKGSVKREQGTSWTDWLHMCYILRARKGHHFTTTQDTRDVRSIIICTTAQHSCKMVKVPRSTDRYRKRGEERLKRALARPHARAHVHRLQTPPPPARAVLMHVVNDHRSVGGGGSAIKTIDLVRKAPFTE